MRSPLGVLLLMSALALAAPAAWSADQALLGKSLQVKDPSPADPSRRRLTLRASDREGSHTISGDPTALPPTRSALLQIFLDGAMPSDQVFALPQGETAKGKPLWKPLRGDGFSYRDAKGEFGPVKSLTLARSRNGTVKLNAQLRGKSWPLALLPPNPGTAAWATLTLGDGDRYCVDFTDGRVLERGASAFGVKKPASEGCPAEANGELLALSYNVAGLPDVLSGSNPEVNTPLIAPLLNDYELVLLQESWKTPEPNPLAPLRVYHEILEGGSRHPFRSLAAPLPIGADPGRPAALVSDGLNRFSLFPFEPVVREAWDGCHESSADCMAFKGFSFARTTLAPGVEVDVYNLHMEAGGDPEDEVLRDGGVSQLSDFIQMNSAGRAVIVGGDFNLHTDEEPDASQYARLLSETGLSDACDALACLDADRIDKFAFRSGGGVTLTPLSHRFETDVFERADGMPLSDHDALAVRFAWSAAAP